MGLGLKRSDLRAVAQAKLDDSLLLIENRRFSNAYYLSGYAIEIGLKACIAAQFVKDVIPDKAFVNEIYKHNLKGLVGVAGLTASLKAAQDEDQLLATNWALVAQWTPETRYEVIDSMSAQAMLSAIIDPNSGVFQWIKRFW